MAYKNIGVGKENILSVFVVGNRGERTLEECHCGGEAAAVASEARAGGRVAALDEWCGRVVDTSL